MWPARSLRCNEPMVNAGVWKWGALLVGMLAAGCGGDDSTRADGFTGVGSSAGGTTGDASGATAPKDPTAAESDSDEGTTSGDPPTTLSGATDPTEDESSSGDSAAQVMNCVYPSTTFGSPRQLLDVMDPNSAVRLSFDIPDVPDPSAIQSATLRFSTFDADHPGEEGYVYVNGGSGLDIPANLAWESMESSGDVDVLADISGGNNRIEFGPGPLQRSYFEIGDVELLVTALVDDCQAQDETDSDSDSDDSGEPGTQMEVHYMDATYTGRQNWVWRCNGFDYAFTAANAKHVSSDCGSLYAPDGSAHGTATFNFANVVEDDYLVEVHAYHTWNRNPNGAIVIVDGVSGTVNQRTSMEGEAFYDTAQWGVAHLEGDVDIVLDSSQGGYASDSVTWVRITPQ